MEVLSSALSPWLQRANVSFISYSHSYSPTLPKEWGQLTQGLQIWWWQNWVWLKDSVGPIHLGWSRGTDFQDFANSCDGANRQFSKSHRCGAWFGLFASFHFQKCFSGWYCSMFPVRLIIVCWKCASPGQCCSMGWSVALGTKSCRFDSQ